MALQWTKIDKTIWSGEEGSWRYKIEARPFLLTGRPRYYLWRRGADYFGSAPSLAGAKRMAHDDMIERERRIMALPNYGAATAS